MEVSARSPPESITRPRIFFFGRLTLISRPSSTSSSISSRSDLSKSLRSDLFPASFVKTKLASPPPNIETKSSLNSRLIFSSPELNSTAKRVSSSLIVREFRQTFQDRVIRVPETYRARKSPYTPYALLPYRKHLSPQAEFYTFRSRT